MLEWLKRHAWKACKLQKGFRGSNPRLSAKDLRRAGEESLLSDTERPKALDKVPAAACGDYEEIPVGESLSARRSPNPRRAGEESSQRLTEQYNKHNNSN